MKSSLPRCLAHGRHTPGSQWGAECPLNPARVLARQERAQRREATKRMARATTAPQNVT
jgi:hypothetical protein